MIGRSVHRASRLLPALLAAVLAGAGIVTCPVLTAAATLDAPPTAHVVIFQSQGTQTRHVTSTLTVGDFLKERGITPGPNDYVHPNSDTPIIDNLIVDYSPAISVKLVTPSQRKTIVTTAGDVGALLEEQGIHLQNDDVVQPELAAPIVAGATIRISRVLHWASTVRQRVAARVVHEIDFSLPPGESRVVKRGAPGLKVTMVDYTQTDGTLRKRVIEKRLVRKPETRVIAEGVGSYAAIADFARRGLEKTSYIASSALDMIATAYTAGCNGCSGYTASGYRAGRGIVAVDPRIIRLGSRLYIPGYGFAIAGDTGGAIVGRRIDLGFDTLDDAMAFGRRPVKVYRLH